MNSSLSDGSRLEQSTSLPGRLVDSSRDLRRVSSRALRAASRALAAPNALVTIARASGECFSSHSGRARLSAFST